MNEQLLDTFYDSLKPFKKTAQVVISNLADFYVLTTLINYPEFKDEVESLLRDRGEKVKQQFLKELVYVINNELESIRKALREDDSRVKPKGNITHPSQFESVRRYLVNYSYYSEMYEELIPAAIALRNASVFLKTNSFILLLDRLIDIVHDEASVLSYFQVSTNQDLEEFLSLKREDKFSELYSLTSSPIKKLYTRIQRIYKK